MKLCTPEECTGCYACFNSCTHQAIEMHMNSEGFYEPLILKEKCTECGLCAKKCPVLNPIKRQNIIEQCGFACWSNDKRIRRESSSGGFFSEVAASILKQSGLVVGAAFDTDFKLKHIIISDIDGLEKLRGSKYTQSEIGNIYSEVQTHLIEGIPVLFSGTPCQIAGLNNYLGKNYLNLYTLDLICHGVPSPLIFNEYKKWLENQYNSQIVNYKFRDKRKSWGLFNIKVNFNTGEQYIGSWFQDPFLRLFLRDYILRESCYSCKYANMHRIGDLTIADFWGFKAKNKQERNTDEGISMVLVNTGKGKMLFDQCKSGLTYFHRDAEVIAKTQHTLSAPTGKPKNRKEFWVDFYELNFVEIINKYGYPQKRSIAQWIISVYGKNRINTPIIWFFNKLDGFENRIKEHLKN
jgi:coenzyme F420-reducing hydrogenase beta subunit